MVLRRNRGESRRGRLSRRVGMPRTAARLAGTHAGGCAAEDDSPVASGGVPRSCPSRRTATARCVSASASRAVRKRSEPRAVVLRRGGNQGRGHPARGKGSAISAATIQLTESDLAGRVLGGFIADRSSQRKRLQRLGLQSLHPLNRLEVRKKRSCAQFWL